MSWRLLLALAGLSAVAGGAVMWSFTARPAPVDDRRQLLMMVARLEQAVEQRRTSTIMRYVSREYHDGYGYDRRMVQRLVVRAAREVQPLDLVVQVGQLEIDGELATARVEVDYSLGAPVGAGESTHISAQVLFRREGRQWKILRADGWQSAAWDF